MKISDHQDISIRIIIGTLLIRAKNWKQTNRMNKQTLVYS